MELEYSGKCPNSIEGEYIRQSSHMWDHLFEIVNKFEDKKEEKTFDIELGDCLIEETIDDDGLITKKFKSNIGYYEFQRIDNEKEIYSYCYDDNYASYISKNIKSSIKNIEESKVKQIYTDISKKVIEKEIIIDQLYYLDLFFENCGGFYISEYNKYKFTK